MGFFPWSCILSSSECRTVVFILSVLDFLTPAMFLLLYWLIDPGQQGRIPFPCYSQSHRIAEVWQCFFRSSSLHPCSSKGSYSRLLRTVSSWVLNISNDGDSLTSLGKLSQRLTTSTVKKCHLVCRWKLLVLNLCPLPLVLSISFFMLKQKVWKKFFIVQYLFW